MADHRNDAPVEAAVSAAILGQAQATRPFGDRSGQALPLQRGGTGAFTLAELLVATGVLVLLVLLATQLVNSAANITISGHKQMNGDLQARELFDRMSLDVMQMIKRSDICYHLKAPASATDCPSTECGTQPGNDEIAFYSGVPGYYASDSTGSQQSPVSLVGYRINSSVTTFGNKMERLGAGLVWNGASPSNLPEYTGDLPGVVESLGERNCHN